MTFEHYLCVSYRTDIEHIAMLSVWVYLLLLGLTCAQHEYVETSRMIRELEDIKRQLLHLSEKHDQIMLKNDWLEEKVKQLEDREKSKLNIK